MGWHHKNVGLTEQGTLYVSEDVSLADAERAAKEAGKSEESERALNERVRALGSKWGKAFPSRNT